MAMQGRHSKRLGGARGLGDHQLLKGRLSVSVMIVVGALTVIGPVAAAEAAEARSSAPRTDVVARIAPTAGLQPEEVALTEADRDLVVKVRLAGLWEIPASKMAVEKGVAPRVRKIGRMIASQHARLDLLARNAAKDVSVELPNEPTAEQQSWLDEMENASGTDFDDVYIARLRAAHGKIFPVIGLIRASTENETVRKLAQSANSFVLTHLTLLESTGLVRYDELPKPVVPAVAPVATAATGQAEGSGIATPVIWLILATVLTAGAVFATRTFWAQGFGASRQRPVRRVTEYQMDIGRVPVQPADNYYPERGRRISRDPRSRP